MLFRPHRAPLTLALGLAAGAAVLIAAAALAGAPAPAQAKSGAQSAHGFSFTSIDGAPMPLSAHRGKVVLVVNTASRCGFTGQYEGLQALWDAKRDEDFVLIGAPSDDFNQELATEAAVKEFCETVFSIDFPMTEIVNVRGQDAHPFFAHAAELVGAPTWNFHKYLVDRNGQIVKRFGSRTTPAEIEAEIDALLAQPAAG